MHENLYQKDKQECLKAQKKWRHKTRHLKKWDDVYAASVAFQEKYGVLYEQKWFDCANACNQSFDDLKECCLFCLQSSHKDRCAERRVCKYFTPFYDEKEYEPILF